jgi:tyrosinase
MEQASGYAGSFCVFGHGGCFGDEGHCDVPTGPPDPFDRRSPHQLTPQTKVLRLPAPVVDRLTTAAEGETITVTVVAETPGDAGNGVLAFDTIRLLTYQ